MLEQSKLISALSARQFAEGLLAGLAAFDKRKITASQAQLHKAFRRVLVEAKKNQNLNVDLSDVDYDPLYGLSGWLDEFLARAQRDLMISSPNPSYQRIEIQLTPEEGESLLSQYVDHDAIKQLSNLFFQELQHLN